MIVDYMMNAAQQMIWRLVVQWWWVAALPLGGLLMLKLFKGARRGIALIVFCLASGAVMGMMIGGKRQAATPAQPALKLADIAELVPQPVEPAPVVERPAERQRLINFAPSKPKELPEPVRTANAMCGSCGQEFFASWGDTTRCPKCRVVMDAGRAKSEMRREMRRPPDPSIINTDTIPVHPGDLPIGNVTPQMLEEQKVKSAAIHKVLEARRKRLDKVRAKIGGQKGYNYISDYKLSNSNNAYCPYCEHKFNGIEYWPDCPKCHKTALCEPNREPTDEDDERRKLLRPFSP